jgi:CheY-like chemotaxis protein
MTAAAPSTRAPNILLVEDNPGDVRLIMECLVEERVREGKMPYALQVALNGEDALAMLRREGAYGQCLRPDLLLLDLNLPKRDGREVLEELKVDPDLRRIPVIVFSSSAADGDVFKSYDLHANCFVTKPVSLDDYIATIRAISDFWFTTVRLPPR